MEWETSWQLTMRYNLNCSLALIPWASHLNIQSFLICKMGMKTISCQRVVLSIKGDKHDGACMERVLCLSGEGLVGWDPGERGHCPATLLAFPGSPFACPALSLLLGLFKWPCFRELTSDYPYNRVALILCPISCPAVSQHFLSLKERDFALITALFVVLGK